MAFALGRALLLSEAVTPQGLSRALFVVATEGVPLPRALVALGLIRHDRLEDELARAEAPSVRQVVPVPELMTQLPMNLCSRLLALPIRRDPRTGTVDVAVADARDPHPAREIGFFLKAPVRVVRAPLSAIEAALDRLPTTAAHHAEALAPPIWMADEQQQQPMWSPPVPRRSSMPPPATTPGIGRRSTAPPPSVDIPIPLLRRSMPGMPALLPDGVDENGDFILSLRPRASLAARPSPSQTPPPVSAPFGFTDGGEVFTGSVAQTVPPALPFADTAALMTIMRTTSSKAQVLTALLAGTRTVARKAGLFVLKNDTYVGWSCTPELGDAEAFRGTAVPLAHASVFATAAAGGTYLGPLYRTEATTGLLDVIGRASRDVAIASVRVRGRPVALVLADDLGDTMSATRTIEELSRLAGEALARIVRRARG